MMKWGSLILITKLVLILNYVVATLGGNNRSSFQGFYFIQQWLPSYCNQRGTTCCYPPTGKPPANFAIYGLWPYNYNGGSVQNCPGASYDVAPLKPLQTMLRKDWPSFTCPQIGRKFWLHEWNKHGTCSKSVLDEMSYFQSALYLKSKINILQALARAGIQPNNQFYSYQSINAAITRATGFRPSIYCNHDAQGNSQVWQFIHCVDRSGKKLINCSSHPSMGQGGCGSTIKFPSY